MSRRRSGGFTLMEMLVTLMLVSFATMLMFQMLGSYRIARERVQGQAGIIDRQALFHDWFRDSVHGLFIAEGLRFAGERTRFRGTSLNPLYAAEGSPTEVEWSIVQSGDRTAIAYSEDGVERWRFRLAQADVAGFTYLDEAGKALLREAGLSPAQIDDLLAREGRLDLARACFDFLPTRAKVDLLGYDDPDIFAH